MENKQDKWNKLINITNEYDENPEIAQNAISKIEQRKAKRRAKMPLKWLSVAASCIVIIGISVFLPVYFSSQQSVVYYSPSSLEYTEVNDIEQYKEDNGLNFSCFTDGVTSSQVITIKDTGELAYINQDAFGIGQAGIDEVSLYIVFMTNAWFDFYRNYEDAETSLLVGDVEVYYSNTRIDDMSYYTVKFGYGDVDYYISINSYDDTTDKVVQYVNQLIN